MLKLVIPASDEFYDETISEFVTYPEVHLELEHSLVSIAKWESKWEKPFLSGDEKTTEQTIDYVRFMTLDDVVSDEVFSRLSSENYAAVSDYIAAKMTATWFADSPEKKSTSREVITAEVIYYWMVTLNIPFECQHWHISRLLTLVTVCNQKNEKPKKSSRADIIARNRALNEQRKAKLGTSG